MSADTDTRSQWRRRWTKWSGPRTHDVLIVVLCAANTVLQGLPDFQFGVPQGWLVFGLGGVATVAMWWRRRYPLLVCLLAMVLYIPSQVVLPLGFGLLTIAVQRRDRVLIAFTIATAVALMLPSPGAAPPPADIAVVVTGVVGALFWALWGAYVGARRDLVASLRERAVRAEDERERRAEQARLAERARIAREMHDVLAHKVSLIALQAGGLEVNPATGPAQVAQTAGQIRTTAREALEDLRGVLGVLRGDQSPASADRQEVLAPQPGLTDVPALVESSRDAGVRVDFVMGIDSGAVPENLGRTVYRVVQEAMTNVHKHARGAATGISISGDADIGIAVRVINQQPVAAGALLPGSGAGLIGLRERLALQGGTLTAGPTGRGGWLVEATLPGWRPGTSRGVDITPARGADATGAAATETTASGATT